MTNTRCKTFIAIESLLALMVDGGKAKAKYNEILTMD
jgi:hypothetical protein